MPSPPPPRRFAAAAAALVLLALLLFREALAGGVLYKRDVHLVWHPQVEGLVHAVAEGAWPLWDPSPAFGQPLLADPGAQALYPPTWLNLVLRPWTCYTLVAIGHVLLASLSFLALARRWGLSAGAAWTGAAVWTLAGPFLSLVDLWHHFAGLSWLPAAFLCAEAALDSERARDVLRLGVVLGLQLLAGSGDACVMTLAALGVHALVVRLGPGRWRAAPAVALRLGAAVALAAAIGAGVWLPALEAASRSARRSLPAQMRTYWSVHPAALAETLLAGVPSALPMDSPARTRLFESREPFFSSLYLGLPCLAMAAFAAFSRDRRRALALAILLAAALLLALGRHTPAYDAVVTLVPPLRVLRYPVKATAIAAFAWAGLVALGAEAWRQAAVSRRAARLALLPTAAGALAATVAGVVLLRQPAPEAFLGIGLAPGAVAGLAPLGRSLILHAALATLAVAVLLLRARFPRPAAAALVAGAVAVVDLAFAHPLANPTAPSALYTHRPEILRSLGPPAAVRVYAYDYGEARPKASWARDRPDRLLNVPVGWSLDAAGALAQQMSLAPQAAGRWRLRQGFDIDYRGLQAEPLAYFTRLPRVLEDQPEALVRVLQLASVTHVVALHDLAPGRLRPVGQVAGLFVAPVRAFAVDGSLPRARVAAGVRVADGIDAVRLLADPGFDAAREVLLAAGAPAAAPARFSGQARVVDERSDRVRVEAELSHAGYLVLADSYDEGWRARVDGRPSEVFRADVAFRAVALAPGRHVVEMSYRPPRVLAAVAVTFVSLAAALLALFVGAPRRDATPGAPGRSKGVRGTGDET